MFNQLPFDLSELDRFSFGDEEFKKELVDIFIGQLPDFIANLNLYFKKQEWGKFAREAHTAKSSVLIFGMFNTGKMLKELQIFAEEELTEEIPKMLEMVISDLKLVLEHLKNQ